MYKMAIWDVSQNVDRFKSDLGLVPCITPGGCDFASNRQQALTGSQLLVLQGMPLDKLIFAGESQKDCQDLAGNAMSTTVIGTSLIAAIIVGGRAFRAIDSTRTDDLSTDMAPQTLGNELVTPSSMVTKILRPSDVEHLDVVELINEAISSSRMCKCEGNKKVCDMPIQVCSACGHTACSLCAGNPKHEYVKIGLTPRQSPDVFIRRWKPKLPARLQFENFPDIFELASKTAETDASTKVFVDRISELDIGSQHFCINSVERQDRAWKILYTSEEATLELNISAQIQWLIFAKCSPKSSGDSMIRKVLEQPVARGIVDESLMSPSWEVLIPRTKKYKIYLTALSERTKSWRNRLGLPDFKSETIPVTLQVQSSTSDGSALEGSYSIQPHCGTASGSLYRSHHNPPVFLFLDPNPIGGTSDDSFVFSLDCSRKHYGEARISLARLNASWRPWQMDDENNRCEITATSSGVWMPTSMRLTSPPVSITASVLSGYSVDTWKGCRDAITVLDVHLPEKLNTQKFSDYSWALEQARSLPSLSQWQPLDAESQACDCAPSYPKILWSIDEAGIATAHEDRKAAANFERSVKMRCPIFHISANHISENTHIKIGINVASLCHRAASRLSGSDSMTAWRLLTDHTDMGFERFPKFRLRSNAADVPYSGPLRLQHDLRGAQPRSLSWMKLQEVGVSLMITEVEEYIHSSLNWRVEARAQTSVRIQGGVLADAPSFGKTVTTIALIQSEFEEHTPAALLKRNRSQTEHLPNLIDVVGTLIVCPPHMVIQWQEELKSFLGTKQYDKFKVLLIEDFTQLCGLTIEVVQDSRVVILSWNVFADEEYISELARFAAMPEPAATGRRAYSAWLNEATGQLPARLAALDTTDYDSFQNDSEQLLEERLQLPEFRAAIPLKVQHGSSYQSFNAMQAVATGKRRASGMKPKSKSKGKGKSRAAHPIPLLHLFRFNRVVVDEYHYLNQDKKIENLLASVSVKSIAAVKRWVLSGTPALANFHDIDQIASFLGTRLGRFANGASRMPTQLEKAIRDDQTDVEKFLSKTETMSRQWHQARHELAQLFLDRFVRQNEPSLEHIDCSEELCPIELNVAHHAVYLELSQHLISQRMQVRKLNNKTNSDRLLRLNASLNNSATAEEALLKSALLFKTLDGESGIEALMQKREEQRRDTERELLRLLCGFEGLKKDADIADLYNGFKNDVKIANWLGDESASKRLCDRLKKAEKNPTRGGFEELKGVPKSKLTQEIKKLMSQLRESARELALRFRSERFIRAIEGMLGPLSRDSSDLLICNSPHCEGATISQLNLASHCGHLACNHCLRLRTDDECCVHQGCNVTVQAVNLIKATDLGSTREQVAERSFGRKMDAIADLVLDIPEQDQCLVFAPNDETIDILEEVFDYHEISFSSTRGIRPAAVARVLEDFKANSNQKCGGSKVLILNLTSETAAGV
jgi:SNF2 family DNA or RNA helicase